MIYIDSRGLGEEEIAEYLHFKHVPCEIKYIESGDYVINDIGIERKTISDLKNSLTNREVNIWQQLKVLKDTYKHAILIIEGTIDWRDRLLVGIIYGIIIGWNIPFINTLDTHETAIALERLHDKYGTAKASIIPSAVRKALTKGDIQLLMLQCIHGIGTIKAKEILQEVSFIDLCRGKVTSIKCLGKKLEERVLGIFE